ncbi:zinc finger, RING/FYVE/PHD-type, acyl-CoA N-acyltransferase, Jas TPL-binding domain protein [Tanacetum coccineum]
MNSNLHTSSVYDSMAHVICPSPEYNPQTIMNYYSCGVQTGRCKDPRVKNLIIKAKNHLSAIGWTFFYVFTKTGTKELRYKAPTGRVYLSLRTACECAIKNQDPYLFDQMGGGSKIDDGFNKFKRKSECVDRPQKKKVRIEDDKSLCFDQKSDKDSSEVKNERVMKQIQDVKRLRLTGKKDSSTKKRGSLIENNIVKRGARVSYLSRKDGRVLKRGRVYEDGIMCYCCDEMFLLTKFEAHAGSTNHRPAANIFFDDNRSISYCEAQLESVLPADVKSTKSDVIDVKSIKSSHCVSSTNDEYSCACWLCHQGQDHDLIKCVQCERHFHLSCINKLGFVVCVDDPARWLCTDNCERIYLGRSYGMKVEM